MELSNDKDKRDDAINSRCRLEWLMARARQPKTFYSRTQMEVFSVLHATFEQRLESFDATDM